MPSYPPTEVAAPATIAIMQPYFIPYAGYFRLFAASDLFVIFDCVQFPRRGWVHRNRLIDASGAERWLTLPLERAPRDALIRDLRFPPDAPALLAQRLRAFSLDAQSRGIDPQIIDAIRDARGNAVDYLEQLLGRVAAYLGLPWRIVRSSSFDIPRSVRGQDRVLAVVRRLGAKRYINSPSGRSLYDPAVFEAAGVELGFLPAYSGPTSSILTRIMNEDRHRLAEDIRTTALFVR